MGPMVWGCRCGVGGVYTTWVLGLRRHVAAWRSIHHQWNSMRGKMWFKHKSLLNIVLILGALRGVFG